EDDEQRVAPSSPPAGHEVSEPLATREYVREACRDGPGGEPEQGAADAVEGGVEVGDTHYGRRDPTLVPYARRSARVFAPTCDLGPSELDETGRPVRRLGPPEPAVDEIAARRAVHGEVGLDGVVPVVRADEVVQLREIECARRGDERS